MNEQKNDEDINIRNILSKNLLDYLDNNSKDIKTSYDVLYNDKGLYLTRTIRQFISHSQIKDIEENEKNLTESNESVNEKKFINEFNDEVKKSVNKISKPLIKNILKKNKGNREGKNKKKKTNFENDNKHLEIEDKSSSSSEKCTIVQNNFKKFDIISDILLNTQPCKFNKKEISDVSEELSLTSSESIPLPYKDEKTGVECGLLPLEAISNIIQEDESTSYETSSQESILDQSASLEQVLQNHIEKVQKNYNVPHLENQDIDFYKTVTEDTVGYIKDLYLEKLHDVYNKLNDINERKIDFMLLLKKKYGFYWFSSTGSCLILFNRLDSIFVSAWQDYLDYLAELDILFKTDTLKGFFKFKSL